MSDTGIVNTSDSFLSDPSEKTKFITHKGQKIRYQSTSMPEWNKTLTDAATPKTGTGTSKQDPRMRRHRVIRDNLQGISRAALARLAHKGGVKQMAGNIHDDIRGAMKIFLKHVVQDAITYAGTRETQDHNGNGCGLCVEESRAQHVWFYSRKVIGIAID